MSSYVLIQISDIHLTADGTLPPGVRPRDNLLAGLRILDDAGIVPDVFLVSGDLADAGDAASYADLADILGTAARSGRATVVYAPGNHDDRAAFRRALLGTDSGVDGPINQTHWRDGLRIIALDSTVPGAGHGQLADATLAYLRAELATPAPDGTIVALHHPPVPTPIRPMARIALRNPDDLRDAIAGSDVRIVLCGHNHHAALGTLGTVPVWVAPATAYRADVTSTETFRGVPGGAFSRIDLSDAGPVATVIAIDPA